MRSGPAAPGGLALDVAHLQQAFRQIEMCLLEVGRLAECDRPPELSDYPSEAVSSSSRETPRKKPAPDARGSRLVARRRPSTALRVICPARNAVDRGLKHTLRASSSGPRSTGATYGWRRELRQRSQSHRGPNRRRRRVRRRPALAETEAPRRPAPAETRAGSIAPVSGAAGPSPAHGPHRPQADANHDELPPHPARPATTFAANPAMSRWSSRPAAFNSVRTAPTVVSSWKHRSQLK